MNYLYSKGGQALLIAAVVIACWWGFSSHYRKAGYASCQAELAKSNQRLYDEQAKRDAESSDISKDATADAGKAVAEERAETEKSEARIEVIYRDRWRTAPVAQGECAYPLDSRVQSEIDNAVQRTNQE